MSHPAVTSAYQRALVIVCAMIATCLVLAGVVEWLRFQGRAPLMPEGLQTIHMGIYLAVAGEVIVLRILRQVMQRTLPMLAPAQVAMRLFTMQIITAALCESIAIMGLLLFLLGGLYRDFYLLVALSLVLQLVHFPRKAEWARWFEGPAPAQSSVIS